MWAWEPGTTQEKLYYDSLFQMADVTKNGKLAGQAAVAFLGRSGLAMPILKQIWDIAGDPNLNYLRREDFYVAMRLISAAQSAPGRPISVERLKVESAVPLPLPRMQGLPVPPAVTLPRGVAASLDDTKALQKGLASADPYAMSAQERSKYQILFPRYDADQDGYITGQEARALFSKSGLPREHLRQIWDLSDADNDNKLSMAEFCVGMHLIVCASKKGLAVPAMVPQSLATSLAPSPNGSSATPLLQSPARPPSVAQSRSTPPAGFGSSSLTAAGTDLGDAFSELTTDKPNKDLASSVGSEAEAAAVPSASTSEKLLSASTVADVSESAVPPHDRSAWRSSVESPAAGNGNSRTGSSDGSWFAAVPTQSETQIAAATHDEVGSANGAAAVLKICQLEKSAMGVMVEAGKAEFMENEERLRHMGVELENLQAELDGLRSQYQEQQRETVKLRQRVTQAAVERGTLLAEIEACKVALDAQEVETEHLCLEEKLIGSTDRALRSYKASLQQERPVPKSEPSQEEETTVGAIPLTTEGLASLPVHQEAEEKSKPTLEPAMTVKTPPPPPQGMSSGVIEDPFADMMQKEGSESGDKSPVSPEAENVSRGPAHQSGVDEKSSGFDAFPPVAEPFESDPFATNGFSANSAGEGAADDPFTASDAVFSNATAAVGDGFDAFPSSDTQFDAFGQ